MVGSLGFYLFVAIIFIIVINNNYGDSDNWHGRTAQAGMSLSVIKSCAHNTHTIDKPQAI